MPDAVTHPTTHELAAFGLGKLSERAAAVVAVHLESCIVCRQAVANVPPDSFLDNVRAGPDASSFPPGLARPGNAPSNSGRSAMPIVRCSDVPPELARHPKFLILRELGRGGMGVVYQARHKEMDRLVVIKVINRSLLDRPETLERFQREIRAAASLSHPNIVTAYDAERVGDSHMLVMEFVPGLSLAEVVQKKGPLPIANACHYVRQVALGLQHAHERNLVHRDIKPQNLMLTLKNQVKILDFGLAKVISERNTGKGLTSSGDYMGTPEYSAPEQAEDASKADIRADLYSLGCTLYCLLAGRSPFREDTVVKTILAHREKAPQPLPELRPDVLERLWRVVARLLAKEPAQRYQNPIEVVQALAPFVKPGPKPDAKGDSTQAADVKSPANGTVIAADDGKIKKIAREVPAKVPSKEVPAKDEAALSFENPVETSALPRQAKGARESAKPVPAMWYWRWPILAAVGGIALVSFLVVNVLIWFSVKPSSATTVAHPPALADFDDVVLKAGYKKTLSFAVERHDSREPLTIRVEGLPDEIKTPPQTLSATEDTASLTLLAPLGMGSSQREARVALWQGDAKLDEKTFHLTIQEVPRPILKSPDNIACRDGQVAVFAFSVERRGCREPLLLRGEGLPPEVRQESAAATDPASPSLKLIVAADVAPREIRLKLLLHVGDVVADSKPLLLNIRKADTNREREQTGRARLKGNTPDSLVIEAGTKGELRVFLDRNGYRGEVQVRLEGLPDGVTALPVAIAAAKDHTIVTVQTRADSQRGEHVLKLLVRADNKTFDERAITLNIEPPQPRQESVHFPTVDGAELAGTLYHGWKRKKGMTVLMLHDLQRNRNTPGWRHLAEALQAEGHTVLTFDFRGHGDSCKVSPRFWDQSVNKHLPVGAAEKSSNKLTADHLPSKYLPWLIQDIVAARTYLDLRHDDPDEPVNTFNLVVIGAGKTSALGSLWLATEGLRFNAADVGDKIILKPPEKLSVRQAVWLGMEDPLKLNPSGVYGWLRDAHAKPVVPITFIYGEDDFDTSALLAEPLHEKLGKPLVLPKTRLSGQHLVEDDAQAAARIQHYLIKTLADLPPVNWVPRHIKSLYSYWALPMPKSPGMHLFVTAKRPGEEMLSAVPMRNLGIPVEGCEEVSGVPQKLPDR